MRRITLSLMLLLVFAPPVFAGAIPIQQVTDASYAGDVDALEATLADTDGASYESAYLKYRLAIGYLGSRDSERAGDLLADTVADLDAVLQQSPDSAEALALKGTAVGMRISFRPLTRGMRMGPASSRAIARAIELDPANPRAWMIKGIGAHNTPTMFGGGNKKALQALNTAIQLFADDNSGWGQADAYVWRGLTHKNIGDDSRAREGFRAALDIAPNYQWAARLLDALDISVAAK